VALRAIRPPRPIAVFRNRGELDYIRPADTPGAKGYGCNGRVVTVAGPWRVHGEWWTPDAYTRDYYDLQLSDGGVYRVYHDLQRDTVRRWLVRLRKVLGVGATQEKKDEHSEFRDSSMASGMDPRRASVPIDEGVQSMSSMGSLPVAKAAVSPSNMRRAPDGI
jgi:hypothetical protein